MSREPASEMNPERWQRVQRLFDEALDRSPHERPDFLAEVCGDDDALRLEVEAMLANFAEAGSTFMEAPAARLGDDLEMPPSAEAKDQQIQPGDRIGPYVLERLLGSGGVGRVYLAKREKVFQKLVAVKLLKRGMDTDELVRRFVSERQILAQLEHPNVAKLLDGGATDDGRHYLVMEYVDGVPIDAYCADNNLNVRQRLDLFLKICDAVHFAHRNLVVHRDLKPSNILVGKDGEPKLLDFGIAKLLRPESFPQTVLPTDPGWRAMTPEYASPEQVRGGLITTASDVYSLAVVLYQLLTGRRPYRLESRSLIDVERAVCVTPPMRPSRAVTRFEEGEEALATGTYVGIDRKQLKQRLVGDLDNILLMALEKEPERRYQSVDQLAADLRRHLDDLPVLARKDSLLYRGSKFIRRHRLPLAGALLVTFMLLTFTATLVVQRGQIIRQRDKAESISRYLEGLFKISDPSQERGESVLARSLLDKGVIDIESLRDQPGLQGDLLGTMGQSYTNLGLFSEAKSMLTRSLELRRQTYGDDDPSVATAKYQLADVLIASGEYVRGQQLARESLELRLDLFGEGHRDAIESRLLLASFHQRRGDVEGANRLFELAEAGARELRDEDLLVFALSRRAQNERTKGNYAAARSMLEEALSTARRLYGEIHPEVASALGELAELELAHDVERAHRLFDEAIAIQRRVYRTAHPDLAAMLNNKAVSKKDRGHYAEAEKLFDEVMEIQSGVYSETSIIVGETLNNLAGLKKDQGKIDEAEELYGRSLEIHRRVLGERHPRTASVLNNLAAIYEDAGRLEAAEALFTTSLDIWRETYGEEHLNVGKGYTNLAKTAGRRQDFAAAETYFQKALAVIRGISEDHAELAKTLMNYGYMKEQIGEREEAEALYLEGLAIARKTQGDNSLTEGQLLLNLTITNYRRQRFEDAVSWGHDAVKVYSAMQGAGGHDLLNARRVLSVVLRAQERYAEAESLLLLNIKECREVHGDNLEVCSRHYSALEKLYGLWGKPAKAAAIATEMQASR